MNMDDAPRRLPPKLHFYILCLVLFVLFSGWSFSGSGFSFSKLIGSPEYLMDFLRRAFPPFSEHRITWDAFFRYLAALVETIQMAFAGTILGIIFGFILALLASKNLLFTSPYLRPIQVLSKGIIAFFRTVPDLVWAIIFVVVVGLGAFAGTLAIMVDTIGVCGRFFAEEMEEVDKSPAEALECCGATKVDAVFSAVIPAAMPGFIATSLFAFEKAVRSSVVLGIVGAGGIGLQLQSLFNFFSYDRAMVIIGMIFILVLAIEQISNYARQKIINR